MELFLSGYISVPVRFFFLFSKSAFVRDIVGSSSNEGPQKNRELLPLLPYYGTLRVVKYRSGGSRHCFLGNLEIFMEILEFFVADGDG